MAGRRRCWRFSALCDPRAPVLKPYRADVAFSFSPLSRCLPRYNGNVFSSNVLFVMSLMEESANAELQGPGPVGPATVRRDGHLPPLWIEARKKEREKERSLGNEKREREKE